MNPVDNNIRRGVDPDVRHYLERAQADPLLRDVLARGDVQQILRSLPAGVTPADIEEFLKARAVQLEQAVLQQWTQLKSDDGSIPPPDRSMHILPMDSDNAVGPEDHRVLSLLTGGKGGMVGKAAPTADSGADQGTAEGDVNAFGQHLVDTVNQQIEGDEEFLSELGEAIFNTQLGLEMEAKHHEVEEAFKRIVSLMRAGLVDPEFVLLAMAKAQIGERGTLYTQLGQRVMRVNQQQSAIAKELGLKSDMGDIEVTRHKLSEKTLGMNQLVSLMQKVTQDIDSIMGSTKSMLEEFNRTKMDIRRNIGGR